MLEKRLHAEGELTKSSSWNKFWNKVLSLNSFKVNLHKDVQHKVYKPDKSMKESQEQPNQDVSVEKEEKQSTLETLGQNGEVFPPTVDYKNPPAQIYVERLPGVLEKLSEEFGEKAAKLIVDNFRYVDEESFFKALDQIADYLKSNTDKPILFLYYRGDSNIDSDSKKSGKWVTGQIRQRLGEEVKHYQTTVEELEEAIKRNPHNTIKKLQEVQIVIADDLINSGEQIDRIVLDPLQQLDKAYSTKFIEDVIVTAVSSKDYRESRRTNLSRVKKLVRVFGNFTLEDIEGLEEAVEKRYKYSNNSHHSIQFYYHKVPDYMLWDVLRERTDDNRWFLDHTAVSPPYDPDRYTTGSASVYAQNLALRRPR